MRLARTSGFASLWVPHHYLTAPMQMLAPIPMLSYLLPEAEGMTIGPNILIMPLLNPVHVAEDAVTLDLLSGGRYVLGIGIGYREAEFDGLQLPLKERAQRFSREHRAHAPALDRGSVTYEGKFFNGRGPRHRTEAAPPGRAADLGRRRSRRGGQARGTDRRCLADHQLRASRACSCRR